jgi:hypothetical protein
MLVHLAKLFQTDVQKNMQTKLAGLINMRTPKLVDISTVFLRMYRRNCRVSRAVQTRDEMVSNCRALSSIYAVMHRHH